MEITAKEISQLLDGTLEGNPDEIVFAPSRIEEGKPGTLTFLAHPKYEDFAYTTRCLRFTGKRRFSACPGNQGYDDPGPRMSTPVWLSF